MFQSSFELTGYITTMAGRFINVNIVSKLFRAYGLYNGGYNGLSFEIPKVSKLFRAYGLYNGMLNFTRIFRQGSFKALSSLRVI